MLNPGMHTANNTFIDNFGEYEPGRDFTDAPNGTGIVNNTFLRNFVVDAIIDTDTFGQRVAYRAVFLLYPLRQDLSPIHPYRRGMQH